MAKKTHVKVRLVPESKPDSPFFTMLKNQLVVKKQKLNFQLRNTILLQENTKHSWKKNFHLTVSNYFFLKLRLS